jgi:methionyl-tRNA formyltransferase
MSKPRLAFMGTPAFAAEILAGLIAARHDIVAVYCQPPRPSGRGQRLQPSPVQALAERHGLAVFSPEKLDAGETEKFAGLRLDAALVAAYGLILPQATLAAPKFGCINVHGSLLPRWRGAAPIERAIQAGDRETGISIVQMEAGLDTGPVLLSESLAIGPETGARTLYAMLAKLGTRLALQALDGMVAGTLAAKPQAATGITYAKKLTRAEGTLDWRQPASALARNLRAFEIFPTGYFTHDDERIRVLAAAVMDNPRRDAAPGTVLDDRLAISCGEAALRLTRLQRAGRDALDAADFLRGYPIPPGTKLPCPVTS